MVMKYTMYMVEIEKQALRQILGIIQTKKCGGGGGRTGIITDMLNMTTRVTCTYEKYTTWFPDVVAVLIL